MNHMMDTKMDHQDREKGEERDGEKDTERGRLVVYIEDSHSHGVKDEEERMQMEQGDMEL
jgi:hypothetical protein